MGHTDIDFEEWLDRTFGRAVTGEWYPQFVDSDEWPEPVSDERAIEYLTRLFEHSEESLRSFSDRQISCGLWELGPGDAHCLYNQKLPAEARERAVGAIATFFRDFFNSRCNPTLGHLDKDHTAPLNSICYMWWEVIPYGAAPDDPDAKRLNNNALDVLEAILQLPNPACKESALHGLGHLAHYRDGKVELIIDRFLANEPDQSPELEQYARAARTGCIQ
jgi:hypothetical protein